MRAFTGSLVGIILALAAMSPSSFGREPQILKREIGNDYLVAKWTTNQGLPQNTVTSILQANDGYIWLGTFGGLARFDGVRFKVFDSTNTPGFNSNRVLALEQDSIGRLWVGTDSGEVYIFSSAGVTEAGQAEGFRRGQVWGLKEDGYGTMFISSRSGIESVPVDPDAIATPGVIGRVDSFNLFRDANRRVWAKHDGRIALLSREGMTDSASIGEEFPEAIVDIAFAPDGEMIVGTLTQLGIMRKGSFSELLPLDQKIHRAGFAVAAFDGSFWFQQTNELLRITGGTLVRYDLAEIVANGSRAMMQDNEGNIWLASQTDGLVKLTRRRVRSISEITETEVGGVYSVLEDPDGRVWLAGGKLFAFDKEKLKEITKLRGSVPFPVAQSLALDNAGRVWVGGQLGLFYVEDDELVPVPRFADLHVQAIFFEKDGSSWVGTETGLLFRHKGAADWIEFTEPITKESIHYITKISDGSVWIGTRRGAGRYRDGRFEQLSIKGGSGNEFIRDIVEDRTGAIWLATYGGGLIRFADGSFSYVGTPNGLPNNFISRILHDDKDRFWLLTNSGIVVAPRAEFAKVASGEQQFVGGAILGTADGLSTSEANGGHQPAGTITSDGRVWFPMISDVAVVDPELLGADAPVVVIESAAALVSNREEKAEQFAFDPNVPVTIKEGVRNLEIDYTGLSFSRAEEIRFFYKLDGIDENWIDAGKRRTAFFPFLPPGEYTFRVKAVTADGVWSSRDATVRIFVAERFWESSWFLAALIAVAAGLIVIWFVRRNLALTRQRQRQLEFSRQLIAAGERERSRIAAELHDGLGQNLLVIKNWARQAREAAAESDLKGSPLLSKIEDIAADTLEETRSIVQDLGSKDIDRFGLTEAILVALEHVEDASGIQIEKRIDDVDGILSKDIEVAAFRIIQECMNNVVKHSESTRAEVRVERSREGIDIRVRDHGVGFDVENALMGSQRSNEPQFGLRNITERVAMLGGYSSVVSSAESGTLVRISIPANEA